MSCNCQLSVEVAWRPLKRLNKADGVISRKLNINVSIGFYNALGVRTCPEKSGKSWNIIVAFSRTGKTWKVLEFS